MKTLALLLVSAGVALAQYGGQPDAYPSQDVPSDGYGASAPVGGYPSGVSVSRCFLTKSNFKFPSGQIGDIITITTVIGATAAVAAGAEATAVATARAKAIPSLMRSTGKCGTCRRLNLVSEKALISTSFSYLTDKNGCKNAVISCPFNKGSLNWIAVGNTNTPTGSISVGVMTQSVVECNQHGQWSAPVFPTSDLTAKPTITSFKFAGCIDLGIPFTAAV